MSTERVVVGTDDSNAYFVPGEMLPNPTVEHQKVDVGNVFTGLQWYQAGKNAAGELNSWERSKILLEIFKEPNDLLSLARTVEMQTGTDGLINSVLESYNWARWSLKPKFQNTSEVVIFKPHIDFEVEIGEELIVESERSLRRVKEDMEIEEECGLYVLDDEYYVQSYLHIYRGGEEIFGFEDENNSLPLLDLRYVQVDGKAIRFESLFTEEEEEPVLTPVIYELSGNNIVADVMELERKSDLEENNQISKESTKSNRTKFDSKSSVFWTDRTRFLYAISSAEGPFSFLPPKDFFGWEENRDKITNDPMAKKALAYFLLPYCDMPTDDGHVYVLHEDLVPR